MKNLTLSFTLTLIVSCFFVTSSPLVFAQASPELSDSTAIQQPIRVGAQFSFLTGIGAFGSLQIADVYRVKVIGFYSYRDGAFRFEDKATELILAGGIELQRDIRLRPTSRMYLFGAFNYGEEITTETIYPRDYRDPITEETSTDYFRMVGTGIGIEYIFARRVSLHGEMGITYFHEDRGRRDPYIGPAIGFGLSVAF